MDYKRELINIFGGIFFAFTVYSVIKYFKLDYFGILALLMIIWSVKIICISIFEKVNLKKWWSGILLIFFVVTLFKFLSPLGFIGYVISILILVGLLIYSRYNYFINAKREIETMIFGKSLDEFSKAGAKPPKIKFIWR